MTQKDLNRMMGQPHAALEGEAANKTSCPLLVMLNFYSKDIVDFVINNKPEGGTTSPFIMCAVGSGSSQPPLDVSDIYCVTAEYYPEGDVEGHIIHIEIPNGGIYYCTDTSGSFDLLP